ncbi:hypothetical protein E2562_015320 [Oryza meyeriana var. granulata]|uniref:Uncharacterized protein n=1 Tax=Oryza meyeriana var. granulata TaxID=110450 RepID=A0A6G1DJ58_9ORYZ|nr:hypothetical protein E2562_015320 [Oryza meyeriana var. granulata]
MAQSIHILRLGEAQRILNFSAQQSIIDVSKVQWMLRRASTVKAGQEDNQGAHWSSSTSLYLL